MPLEIMIGAPVAGAEAMVLRQICRDIGSIDVLVLVNFEVNHRQIDFLIVTNNYAAIIELKCFRGPVFGDINGDWFLEDFSRQKKLYVGGNPWQQALGEKFALSDTMAAFQANHPNAPQPLGRAFYSEFDAFVCVYPEMIRNCVASRSLSPGGATVPLSVLRRMKRDALVCARPCRRFVRNACAPMESSSRPISFDIGRSRASCARSSSGTPIWSSRCHWTRRIST
jgi:hypothetical protein